ncbi:MAG: CapA family protein [Candidatus Pacebacteria bacterium]|nr:CapA family protein [Candidatus Paceibacterota bacterium]
MFKKITFLILIILSLLFLNKEYLSEEDLLKHEESQQILFVGDMMFDRGVEFLMENNSFDYPFEKIKEDLLPAKILVGNLEGPIVSNPVFISAHSMSFSFNKKVAQILRDNNFSIVSLANNHTSNMGEEGLEETKNFLQENGIDYVGDPDTCSSDGVIIKDGIAYFSVNVTFPYNCSKEDIVFNINKIREESEYNFLVVLVHWGNEYEHLASDYQIELAHLIIDAGADLIIGGHPHVIQNIEKYNGKLIFYSLGNFIFDQYFSEETQQGLMIDIRLSKDRQDYNIIVVEENKAQPAIIESQEILKWLASISSESLKEEIEGGKIVIY